MLLRPRGPASTETVVNKSTNVENKRNFPLLWNKHSAFAISNSKAPSFAAPPRRSVNSSWQRRDRRTMARLDDRLTLVLNEPPGPCPKTPSRIVAAKDSLPMVKTTNPDALGGVEHRRKHGLAETRQEKRTSHDWIVLVVKECYVGIAIHRLGP